MAGEVVTDIPCDFCPSDNRGDIEIRTRVNRYYCFVPVFLFVNEDDVFMQGRTGNASFSYNGTQVERSDLADVPDTFREHQTSIASASTFTTSGFYSSAIIGTLANTSNGTLIENDTADLNIQSTSTVTSSGTNTRRAQDNIPSGTPLEFSFDDVFTQELLPPANNARSGLIRSEDVQRVRTGEFTERELIRNTQGTSDTSDDTFSEDVTTTSLDFTDDSPNGRLDLPFLSGDYRTSFPGFNNPLNSIDNFFNSAGGINQTFTDNGDLQDSESITTFNRELSSNISNPLNLSDVSSCLENIKNDSGSSNNNTRFITRVGFNSNPFSNNSVFTAEENILFSRGSKTDIEVTFESSFSIPVIVSFDLVTRNGNNEVVNTELKTFTLFEDELSEPFVITSDALQGSGTTSGFSGTIYGDLSPFGSTTSIRRSLEGSLPSPATSGLSAYTSTRIENVRVEQARP